MKLEKGDRVKFMNETGEGEVVDLLDSGNVIVKTEDGFDMEYPLSELVKVNHEEEEDYFLATDAETVYKAVFDAKSSKKFDRFIILDHLRDEKRAGKKRKYAEIDLHIEELAHLPGKLKGSEKLSIQLDYAQRCLEEAHELKIMRLIFIHGVGEGILKTELRKLLMNYSHIVCHDAPYNEYGNGATEVELRGLHS